MKYLLVLVCVIATAYGHSDSWGWGSNTGGNNGGNNGGSQGNFLAQLLQYHMGQNNNNQNNNQHQHNYGGQWDQHGGHNWGDMGGHTGGNTGGNTGGSRPQGTMVNNVLGSLLGNILGSVLLNNLKGGQMHGQYDRDDEERKDEVDKMEDLMKQSMATELFDLMRAYNDMKENEEEFGKATAYLCYMVNITYVASRENNFQIYNKTSEESLKEMEEASMGMSEAEKKAASIDILMNDPKTFSEIFFRFASWVCHAGKDYLESAMKLDKLKKGDKCEHGRD